MAKIVPRCVVAKVPYTGRLVGITHLLRPAGQGPVFSGTQSAGGCMKSDKQARCVRFVKMACLRQCVWLAWIVSKRLSSTGNCRNVRGGVGGRAELRRAHLHGGNF